MRDLLTNSIALHDQLEAVHGPLLMHSTPGALRPRLREVPSLIAWVFCFTAYIAVRTQEPTVRDMLTYCWLVIRKVLRHGGQGWQDYDHSFRSQAAIDCSLRWNTLLPDLQASTILGQPAGSGTYCSLCTGVDHAAAQCTLAYVQQPTTPVTLSGSSSTAPSSGSHRPTTARSWLERPICTSWNSGGVSTQALAHTGMCEPHVVFGTEPGNVEAPLSTHRIRGSCGRRLFQLIQLLSASSGQ